MRRLYNLLLAPNAWVAVFVVLAVLGTGSLLVGVLTRSSLLREVGLWLSAPFLAIGLLLVVVVVPLLLVHRALNPGQARAPSHDERAVQREPFGDLVQRWAQRLQDAATGRRPAGAELGAFLAEIVPLTILQDVRGTLLYREPFLATSAGAHTVSAPPLAVPCISPNYAGGRLVIQQALDRVPGGAVEVVVARRRGEKEVEAFPPRRIQLERTQPPEGLPYWYADVPLKLLIDDFRPGDDLIYCVVAAPAA